MRFRSKTKLCEPNQSRVMAKTVKTPERSFGGRASEKSWRERVGQSRLEDDQVATYAGFASRVRR